MEHSTLCVKALETTDNRLSTIGVVTEAVTAVFSED